MEAGIDGTVGLGVRGAHLPKLHAYGSVVRADDRPLPHVEAVRRPVVYESVPCKVLQQARLPNAAIAEDRHDECWNFPLAIEVLRLGREGPIWLHPVATGLHKDAPPVSSLHSEVH